MRQLKFRAWDKTRLIMHKTSTFREICEGGLDDLRSFEEFEFLQFTGLLDKSGKEIYEGDILEFSRYWSDHFGRDYSQVIFLEENAQFVFNHSTVGTPQDLGMINKEAKVIGNIYETPELLTTPK